MYNKTIALILNWKYLVRHCIGDQIGILSVQKNWLFTILCRINELQDTQRDGRMRFPSYSLYKLLYFINYWRVHELIRLNLYANMIVM